MKIYIYFKIILKKFLQFPPVLVYDKGYEWRKEKRMDWNVIESRQNAAVKSAASLCDKKARDRAGLFVAEGKTLVLDLLSAGICPEALYLDRKAEGLCRELDEVLEGRSCRKYLLSSSAFEKISSEKGSEGILAVISYASVWERRPLLRTEKLIALEGLQDPGNVGTLVRTAAAFGFDGVLLAGCTDPFGPKAIRASMGAVARIPLRIFPDTDSLFDFLEERNVHTVAACLEPDSRTIDEVRLIPPVCVLIGNEGRGLSRRAVERATEKAIIPMQGMESLNAAVAGSVFLWEISRQKEAQ